MKVLNVIWRITVALIIWLAIIICLNTAGFGGDSLLFAIIVLIVTFLFSFGLVFVSPLRKFLEHKN